MGFPADTDYPDALDLAQNRVDGADIVWDDDFNYQDKQIRKLQDFIGLRGEMAGQRIAGKGLAGMVSPIASAPGARAFRFAARAAFAAGDLLSVGDAYDTVYTEKMRLDYTGLLWALAGIDASQMLKIPRAALPAPGVAGRLQWDTGALGLYFDNGVIWIPVGGASAGSYIDMATGYSYVQAPVPVEETMGQGVFNGAKVIGSLVPTFRAILETVYVGAPGPSTVRLYDMGPKAGPPGAPVLIATLQTVVPGGPQVLEQALAVGAVPGVNTIMNTERMYEVTVEQASSAGDTIYVGSVGLTIV